MMKTPALPESLLPGLGVAALDASAEPRLQRFFDANPEYFLATTGQVACPTDAHDELNDGLPEAWPYSAITRLGYFNAQGELAAMANVVSDSSHRASGTSAPSSWKPHVMAVGTRRPSTRASSNGRPPMAPGSCAWVLCWATTGQSASGSDRATCRLACGTALTWVAGSTRCA